MFACNDNIIQSPKPRHRATYQLGERVVIRRPLRLGAQFLTAGSVGSVSRVAASGRLYDVNFGLAEPLIVTLDYCDIAGFGESDG
jgi:hypothetical protein